LVQNNIFIHLINVNFANEIKIITKCKLLLSPLLLTRIIFTHHQHPHPPPPSPPKILARYQWPPLSCKHKPILFSCIPSAISLFSWLRNDVLRLVVSHSLFSFNQSLFSSLHELNRVCDLQKGESRMDAALDAMKPYGFPNRLVRTTVNSLLKVKIK